jgi:hypothetical protein
MQNNLADNAAASSNDTKDAFRSALRQELTSLLPELITMVLSIYGRGGSNTSELIPQLAFSDSVIRLTKILASINLAGGELNDAALQSIVRGLHGDLQSSSAMTTRATISPSRTMIADTLLRAMPGPNEYSGLSAIDQMLVLAGIASVFSILGLQRKKAIILKEYLTALIQALTQAKKAGAAEAGFHPSTKLSTFPVAASSSPNDVPEGLEDFLNLLCQVYGIPESKWSQSIGSETLQIEQNDQRNSNTTAKNSHLPEQLVGNFVLRFFGSVNVKSDVLRTCIQLCEALPDLHGVLHYTSALLRTAGPGIAPSADTSDVLVTLAREEQILLANNVSKAVTNATSLGIHDIEAEYWDEFLVRGVYLVGAPASLVLHPHRRTDLGVMKNLQNDAKQGPFLHNPFLDRRESKIVDDLLVIGDDREFVVSLQNPYDFEVSIESLRLLSDTMEFASAQNLVLRPYRTQSFSVMGVIRQVGRLNLRGCTIKIRGCRERIFPIFKDPWAPEQDVKIKNIGLMKKPDVTRDRPSSDDSASSLDRMLFAKSFPTPASVSLRVLPEQPVVVVSSVSLPHSAMMLLEGESGAFSVSVQNTSHTVTADFIHISFRDSTSSAIKEALGNNKLSPAELFELEHQLAHRPAIQACGNPPTRLEPGQVQVFEFQVLGKPGLTTVVIQMDYANLSQPHTEAEDEFFTRQVIVPVSVTVNASVQLQRLEIMPISRSLSWGHELVVEEAASKEKRLAGFDALLAHQTTSTAECCLLLLDLRNCWPTPLEISLQHAGLDSSHITSELVQPGHVCRMMVLIPKIFISRPHARIRSANERQFVVSTTGISPESERATREVFWYREELLKLLQGSWRQEDGVRAGSIDLRSMLRVNARMVDTLKLDDVAIEMSVLGSEDEEVSQTARSSFEVVVDDYLTVKTKITNRSDVTIYPILRLRPTLAHQPTDMALELGKRLVWSGLLQQVLTPLEPGATVEASLAICALCSGDFEIGASVEEIRVCKRDDEAEVGSAGGIPDPVASTMGRRTWTASEPCRIRAVEDV